MNCEYVFLDLVEMTYFTVFGIHISWWLMSSEYILLVFSINLYQNFTIREIITSLIKHTSHISFLCAYYQSIIISLGELSPYYQHFSHSLIPKVWKWCLCFSKMNHLLDFNSFCNFFRPLLHGVTLEDTCCLVVFELQKHSFWQSDISSSQCLFSNFICLLKLIAHSHVVETHKSLHIFLKKQEIVKNAIFKRSYFNFMKIVSVYGH